MSPHEIAQLAQTRRDDPAAALAIATEAGKAHDALIAKHQQPKGEGKCLTR